MKRILLILSFILLFVLYGTAANYSYTINSISEKTNIENVNKIKMYLPGTIKVYSGQETNFIKIHKADSILLKNLIYEFTDSTLNIKLKHGTYQEWSIDKDELKFIIGVNSDAPVITVSNDLILSQNKIKNNLSKSNHATQNN